MKTIVDSVHGTMEFPAIVIDIINTAEFQRLKNLKQLGVTHYVFPSVTHSRFEHCLGVCHLAAKLMDRLERNSGLKIPVLLRNCVEIAGLLHDIGHGPFSHAWEHFVHLGTDVDWTHEESSCRMVEHLFEKNQIRLSNGDEEHFFCIDLIKSLIVGDQTAWKDLIAPDLWFITEIVNNKFCFIDVDKWDYLLRDAYYLKNAIDNFHQEFDRFFEGARVTAGKDFVTHISYHVDDYCHIYELFENRSNFHIHFYQHPTTLGVEML
jgi:deoxynucleoside triphosphate triphosphohydrolase SAMHD1